MGFDGDMKTPTQYLLELVRIPSVNPPGREALLAEPLAELFRSWGGETELIEVLPGRPNLVATWDFGPGPTLLFNTHLDVNAPAPGAWSFDPFDPFIEDGKIFGCGACDAKGSLAGMVWAMGAAVGASGGAAAGAGGGATVGTSGGATAGTGAGATVGTGGGATVGASAGETAGKAAGPGSTREPNGLRGRLVFTGVMGEESGGLGTLHLTERGLRADGAVVGEPTGVRVMTANKGTFIRRITLQGKASHSGQPDLGVNAIYMAARLLTALHRADDELRRRPHPLVGRGSYSPTLISGGTVQNTIPRECTITLDRRLVPGETHQQAREELEAILEALDMRSAARIEELVATDPCESPGDAAIVAAAQRAVRRICGADAAALRGFPAGCDMSKLVNLAGIPSVILGPGSLEQAHAPDEFVDAEEVETAARVYLEVIHHFLGADAGQAGGAQWP